MKTFHGEEIRKFFKEDKQFDKWLSCKEEFVVININQRAAVNMLWQSGGQLFKYPGGPVLKEDDKFYVFKALD